mmetsp:Transcript_9044/g.22883  ORF Transcript_9044/g.22883 Transcript_9044/m.22883 type:complete len:217 (-) Transcript_9044:115-765(-)
MIPVHLMSIMLVFLRWTAALSSWRQKKTAASKVHKTTHTGERKAVESKKTKQTLSYCRRDERQDTTRQDNQYVLLQVCNVGLYLFFLSSDCCRCRCPSYWPAWCHRSTTATSKRTKRTRRICTIRRTGEPLWQSWQRTFRNRNQWKGKRRRSEEICQVADAIIDTKLGAVCEFHAVPFDDPKHGAVGKFQAVRFCFPVVWRGKLRTVLVPCRPRVL